MVPNPLRADNMTPANYDITIYQGATLRLSFVWKTGEPATAVDLTGYTARMHIREYLDAPTTLIELTTTNGRITLGGVAGTIDLFIAATDTTTMAWDAGVYDLELVNGTDVVRFMQGTVRVYKEVTR